MNTTWLNLQRIILRKKPKVMKLNEKNLMVYKVPKVYIPFLGFHFYNVLEMPKL